MTGLRTCGRTRNTLWTAFALALFTSACNGGRSGPSDASKGGAPPGAKPAVPVEVLVVRTRTVVQDIALTGVLQPVRAVEIVAEASGKIERIHKKLGDPVAPEDTLAVVDDEIPWSQYRQARAQVLSAENNLKIARLNYESDRGECWDTPRLWPLNAAEYRKLERILTGLADRRILVYPFAGFFGKNANYPVEPADQARYIAYTLARLGPFWNILLNVAGPEPNVGKSWMSAEDVERLGRKIRELDPFGHPLSVHNRGGDDPYRDAPWTDYGTLQGPKTADRATLSARLLKNRNPQKALFAQETLWSGNRNHPDYTDADLRKNAYVINLSAAALCFGDVAGYSSSGFSGSIDLSDRNQGRHDILKRVWDFVETLPFHRMRPRQDLVDAGYCLAEEGAEYLVYLESPATVNVTLSGGPYAATWINAQATSDRRPTGTTTEGRNLSPPGRDGWLLHLVRRS